MNPFRVPSQMLDVFVGGPNVTRSAIEIGFICPFYDSNVRRNRWTRWLNVWNIMEVLRTRVNVLRMQHIYSAPCY